MLARNNIVLSSSLEHYRSTLYIAGQISVCVGGDPVAICTGWHYRSMAMVRIVHRVAVVFGLLVSVGCMPSNDTSDSCSPPDAEDMMSRCCSHDACKDGDLEMAVLTDGNWTTNWCMSLCIRSFQLQAVLNSTDGGSGFSPGRNLDCDSMLFDSIDIGNYTCNCTNQTLCISTVISTMNITTESPTNISSLSSAEVTTTTDVDTTPSVQETTEATTTTDTTTPATTATSESSTAAETSESHSVAVPDPGTGTHPLTVEQLALWVALGVLLLLIVCVLAVILFVTVACCRRLKKRKFKINDDINTCLYRPNIIVIVLFMPIIQIND